MMRRRAETGLSLVEATIVLAAVAVLTAAMAPVTSRAIDSAKLARAVDDEEAIKTAIQNFMSEMVGYNGFVVNGTSKSSAEVDMLVSDGDTPTLESFTGDDRWTTPVTSTPPTGYPVTDFLERHLVTNNPFGDGTKAYPLSGGATWRGAYISAPIDPDPWGNRYAANVEFLNPPTDQRNDVIVYSAGPNETIDTAYQQDGMYPGDDDIIVVVRRDAGVSVP